VLHPGEEYGIPYLRVDRIIMLNNWVNITIILFCILALIISAVVIRAVKSTHQTRHSRTDLIAPEHSQARSTTHDMSGIRASNDRGPRYTPIYQADYEKRDASIYLYKAQRKSPKNDVRHDFVRTLQAPPAMLLAVLQLRAILLYQEQDGTTWQEAWQTIHELVNVESYSSETLGASTHQGTDPMVTYLLLRAGYRDDAIAYFRWGSGAGLPEAVDAINFFQQHIIGDGTQYPDLPRRVPDLDSIEFLLRIGRKLVAIRYYRECTGVNIIAAKDAIVTFQKELEKL